MREEKVFESSGEECFFLVGDINIKYSKFRCSQGLVRQDAGQGGFESSCGASAKISDEVCAGDVNIQNRDGERRSIIFVHGNGESGEIFYSIAQRLSRDFTVFCPDSRGHGRSGRVKRLHYADMADDIAELIRHERLTKPMLFGFSDGGIVGLMLAAKYPELLGKLFVAGINLSPKGLKPSVRRLMRFSHFFSRSDKLRLMLTEPNITASVLQKIKSPTTIFYAENDIVSLSDSKLAEINIPDCRLVFVPNERHESYVLDNDKLYALLCGHLGD